MRPDTHNPVRRAQSTPEFCWRSCRFCVCRLLHAQCPCMHSAWVVRSRRSRKYRLPCPCSTRSQQMRGIWARLSGQRSCVYYPLPAEPPILLGILGAALLLGISEVAFRWRERCPWLLVGWLWFLGTLVPVIGLVHVGRQAMADRYIYIPSIGLFWRWCGAHTTGSPDGGLHCVGV